MDNLTGVAVNAILIFLGIGLVSGLAKAFWGVRTHSRRERLNRERFWTAIPALADMLAKEPGSRRNTADWNRSLGAFYLAGFSLDETLALVRRVPVIPPAWDFLDWLARKNAWAERTFGPGDATDRVAGLSDHIRKELDELAQDPMNREEWIDLVFLALDGAYRAGATPQAVADTLEGKLLKNIRRTWPDWRTVPAGQAIEHVRGSHD